MVGRIAARYTLTHTHTQAPLPYVERTSARVCSRSRLFAGRNHLRHNKYLHAYISIKLFVWVFILSFSHIFFSSSLLLFIFFVFGWKISVLVFVENFGAFWLKGLLHQFYLSA